MSTRDDIRPGDEVRYSVRWLLAERIHIRSPWYSIKGRVIEILAGRAHIEWTGPAWVDLACLIRVSSRAEDAAREQAADAARRHV